MRTLRLMLLMILASLALAACAQGEQITAEKIIEGMKQTRETTRDAHAVAQIATTGGEQAGNFVLEVWTRKTDKTDAAGNPIAQLRAKVLEASKDEVVGSEFVNDGETIWLYNPTENKVITGKLDDLKRGDVGTQDPTAQMMRMQEQLQQLLDGSDVEIVSENEVVAGREAWQVKLTPKAETSEQLQLGSVVNTTLWIGKDRYIPLRASVDAGDLGKLDATVREIQLDEGVDAALFTFTPPEGAEVVDAAELAKQARPQTTSLEDARANASFPVLAPSPLPQGVVLDEVQVLSMGGETVLQNYSGSVSFSLVQSASDNGMDDRMAPFGARTQSVTVRGETGTLITGTGNEQGTLLRWQENGVTIIVAGTLNAEQAQAIAASLK
jgi:outer membrane lipoprotein-sorting protein